MILEDLNNCAAMSANTSANQVVWGVERVASEPPTAPGCYNVYFFNRHKRTFFQASGLPFVLIQIACSVLCSYTSSKRQIKQFEKWK